MNSEIKVSHIMTSEGVLLNYDINGLKWCEHFNVVAAIKDAVLRTKLIELGWAPPEEVQKLREALIECKRQAASMRTWNGMGWTYHPPQAKKIFDTAEAVLSTLKTESKP